MPYITSIFHICTIISLIAMVALFIASIMNYQREKQHENDVKSAVRECKQSGWNFSSPEIKRTHLVRPVANGSIILRIVHSLTMYAERLLPKVLQLRQKCLTQEKVCAAST